MTRLSQRLRAAISLFVASALILLSPGLEAPRLFAQAVHTAPVETISPAIGLPGGAPAVSAGLGLAPALTAPSLSAPSLFAPAPGASAALVPAAAAPVAAIAALAAAPAAASSPAEAPKAAAPAASAPAPLKTVDSAVSYRVQRLMLKTVSSLTGATYSLPAAGAELTDKLIEDVANKQVVLSDYDDTLAAYKTVLPQDMVDAITAVRAAGKDFVVISDRGDEPKPGDMTVFQSLESLPVSVRAGMYVAANSGGRVYRYDEDGRPVRVFEAPALTGELKARAAEAAEATKARLHEIGTEAYVPPAGGAIPSESWNTYNYAMMLKVGSSEAQVRGAAAILRDELAMRGFDVEVNPRFAKDPANPPYLNFSVITKKTAAAYIAKALHADAKDVLIIGDSMYVPSAPKKAFWLARLGAVLSGRAIPATGNRTDANMSKGVPGAMTFSVGTSGDPHTSNLWVLGGKGPDVTLRVLQAVASKPRLALAQAGDRLKAALNVAAGIGFVAAIAASYYFFVFHIIPDILSGWEQQLHDGARDAVQDGAIFGGTVGWGMSLGAGKRAAAPAPSLKASVSAAGPVEGFSTYVYAAALAAARAHAVELGYKPDNLRVTSVRLAPGARGEDWAFTFVSPRENALKDPLGFELSVRRTMAAEAQVDVHGLKDLGRESRFVGFYASKLPEFVRVSPMAVIGASGDAARTLEVQARWTGSAGEPELWYVVRGDKGRELSAINAKTGEPDRTDPWAGVKSAAITIAALAFTAGLYVAVYLAIAHAWSSVPPVQTPDDVGVPSNPDLGAVFGGTLGAVGLSGTLGGAKKAALSDDEIAEAAKSVIRTKGGGWSETDYRAGYWTTISDLTRRGATDAQIERFKKLCDDAPINGRFSQWSGD